MKFPFPILAIAFWAAMGAWGGAGVLALPPSDAASVLPRLESLARAASDKRGWPALRSFAESAPDAESRGQAFFTLGYYEFEADDYVLAVADLERAADTRFSLSDYAEYFAAASEREIRPQNAIEILQGFDSRYPQSALRLDALTLFATALNQQGDSGRALLALTTRTEAPPRPAFELLLAQTEQKTGNLENSVRAFQEVYYNFPTSPEARIAGQALEVLRRQLGAAKFPAPSGELETARPEILFNHARTSEALREYTSLLQKHAGSNFAPQWKVGRARVWLRLKRTTAALNQLQSPFPSDPAADAQRLAALVDAYIQRDDQPAMEVILAQLRAVYPHSPAYLSALDAAGNHLVRKGDWNGAASDYAVVAESFPQTPQGDEASWRVAWTHYLQKDTTASRLAFVDHATRYPESIHVPADFYWLGRLAEGSGEWADARAFYQLIEGRWAQSYYAEAARHRLAALPPEAERSRAGDAQPGLLADVLAKKVPPALPPVDVCPPAQPLPMLHEFDELAALGLQKLASENLKALLLERPASSPLRIALSRFEAENQNYNPSLIDAARAVPLFPDYDFSALPGETWRLLFPQPFLALVQREARARGLDPYLVMGLIREESAFYPRALSPAKARGLMQILLRTARTRKGGHGATVQRLYDPEYNLRVGCDLLAHLMQLNNGVPEEAMAAYHAGEERVAAWLNQRTFAEPAEFLESIPIPATRVYVEKVLRDAAIYRRLLNTSPVFKKCSQETLQSPGEFRPA